MARFVIEDEFHCEWHGEFASETEALVELNRRAQIPWDQEPNRAPCMSWRTCGRGYWVIEFDDTLEPWKELKRTKVLEVSAAEVKWHGGIR
jgi:hypothetical protein